MYKEVLQEKLRKLKEAMLCMLCCEEEINSTFCPCGHTVCCKSCAAQLQVSGHLAPCPSRRGGNPPRRVSVSGDCSIVPF